MERLLFAVCLLAILIGAPSCSNDFELIDDWKDIPVVYGLLSTQDTAHYVRLEKAFLDPNTSAEVTAQIIDSIYYKDASVSLIRLSNEQEYPMTRVNGNLEGFPREEGVFANDPNYLYKLKLSDSDSLFTNEIYQLSINRGDDLPLVTGEVRIVSDIEIKKPTQAQAILWEYDNELDFSWRPDVRENVAFYNIVIDLHYSEDIGDGEIDKVIEWKLGGNIVNDDNSFTVNYEIPGESFYTTIASNIEENSTAIRKFKFMDFKVLAGGQEIYDYIQVNQVNTGITGSQLLPNFTNMSEGFGIISSTNSTNQVNFLNSVSRDSLRNGIHTKNLNFE